MDISCERDARTSKGDHVQGGRDEDEQQHGLGEGRRQALPSLELGGPNNKHKTGDGQSNTALGHTSLQDTRDRQSPVRGWPIFTLGNVAERCRDAKEAQTNVAARRPRLSTLLSTRSTAHVGRSTPLRCAFMPVCAHTVIVARATAAAAAAVVVVAAPRRGRSRPSGQEKQRTWPASSKGSLRRRQSPTGNHVTHTRGAQRAPVRGDALQRMHLYSTGDAAPLLASVGHSSRSALEIVVGLLSQT